MNFLKEIKTHNAPGYHRIFKYSDDFNLLVEKEGYKLSAFYVDFIKSIGYGHFFGGSLVLFPLTGETGSVRALTNYLQGMGVKGFVAIGYAGTTEGYYCLKNEKEDNAVYWVNVQTKATNKLDECFEDWINTQSSELFNPDTYAAYKKIKDIESVYEVIKERSFIEVELLDFKEQLIKPPGNEKDFLPRYNKVILAIRKNKEVKLSQLTIKFSRSGSSIEEDNVEYLTVDIGFIPINKSEVVQSYLFDPFNLPFEKIECDYHPEIDLTSKMRVRYKEIKKFL